MLERVAEAVRRRLPDRLVYVAHMELATPDIRAAVDACAAAGVDEVVVHPYFLVPGRHASRDIPRLAREAASRHPGLRMRVSEPLGIHEGLVQTVVDRVRDAERR